MRVVRVRVATVFTSFRDPTTHKFQRTFPLPPATTVKGFLGAAFGIPPESAIELDIEIAVCEDKRERANLADSRGKTIDLWKYDKYKSGRFDTKATVKRDILYRRNFILYFVPGHNAPSVDEIGDAIRNPGWALSLGRDDELVKIVNIASTDLAECEVNRFVDTLLPFDFKTYGGKPAPDVISSFLSGTRRILEPPLVASLPRGFVYNSNGVREITDLQPFTFVGSMPIILAESVRGVCDDEFGRSLVLC
jgi:CRISPR-associated Cas5-like protein